MDPDGRWEIIRGRIPISIVLDPAEVAAAKQPEPFFSLCHRVAYLSHLVGAVHRHFQRSLVPSYGCPIEPWFDYKGNTLNWRFPVGVLYDIFTSPSLPWRLTVHFTVAPSQTPSNLPTASTVIPEWSEFREIHHTALKQALNIFHGHGKAFGSLHHEIQLSLDEAMRQVDLKVYDSLWLRYLLGENVSLFKKIPVRVHLKGRHQCRLTCVSTHPAVKMFGKPVPDAPLKFTTLLEFLEGEVLPPHVHPDRLEVIVHGVIVSELNTPLFWLGLVASHLDGFLHLVLREKRNNREPRREDRENPVAEQVAPRAVDPQSKELLTINTDLALPPSECLADERQQPLTHDGRATLPCLASVQDTATGNPVRSNEVQSPGTPTSESIVWHSPRKIRRRRGPARPRVRRHFGTSAGTIYASPNDRIWTFRRRTRRKRRSPSSLLGPTQSFERQQPQNSAATINAYH